MDADTLNRHLENGGTVVVSTYLRATCYRKRHAGMFSTGRDGNLYVQHGRGKNCLSMNSGRQLLVAIRMDGGR